MGLGGSRRVPKIWNSGLNRSIVKAANAESQAGPFRRGRGEHADRSNAILLMYHVRFLPKTAFIIAGINTQ